MDTRLFYIFNNTGIESEIRNFCGRNFGTGGNSNFTLEISFDFVKVLFALNNDSFIFALIMYLAFKEFFYKRSLYIDCLV